MERKRFAIENLPLVLLVGIFPLLVYRLPVETYTEGISFLPSEYYSSDFFLKIKWIALMVIALMMLCILVKNRVWKYWPMNRIATVLLGGYVLLVILSSAFAKHTWLAFRGLAGVMQGALVICAYMVIVIYASWWRKNKYEWHSIAKTMVVMIAILGAIGVSQFVGLDVLAKGPLAWALGGKESYGKKLIYGTLFHWNYVGSFVVLLVPIVVWLFYYYKKNKNHNMQIFMAIDFYILVFLICGAQSRTGMCGLVATAVVASILNRKRFRTEWLRWLGVLLFVMAIFMFCNYYITGSALGRWDQISFHTKAAKGLKSIETKKDKVVIRCRQQKAYLTFSGTDDKQEYELKDTNGNAIQIENLSIEKNSVEKDFKIIYGYDICYKKLRFFISNQTDKEGYYYYNPVGKWDKIVRGHTALPSGVNEFASLRGFVWSRSIPLLEKYLVLGAGADQFVFAFPNRDYVARARYDMLDTYYNKPHNWYLQMATESGVISLVLMLAFFVIYLCKGKKDALWFAALGYLIAALFNDSFLTVAPLFWAIVGMKLGEEKNKGERIE